LARAVFEASVGFLEGVEEGRGELGEEFVLLEPQRGEKADRPVKPRST